MSKKQSCAIIAAFGEVQKAAEENQKARDAQEKHEAKLATKEQILLPKAKQVEDIYGDDDEDYIIETKTKRVNFLLYPSVFEKAKIQARKHRQSLNDYVNTVLAKDVYV